MAVKKTITLHEKSTPNEWDGDMKPETLTLLEENIGSTLQNIGVGKTFLDRIPFLHELRPVNDKLNLIKLKSFCTAKEITE